MEAIAIRLRHHGTGVFCPFEAGEESGRMALFWGAGLGGLVMLVFSEIGE